MEIYLITDLTNGKKYVGKTINTKEQRWSTHLHGDLYVDNAIRKHGIENTTLETLEYVYDEDILNEKEQYWIKELDTLVPNGYNILPGGDCSYGRNTVHEFNQEQYLRRIFYPPIKSKRSSTKCKIYIIDSDKLNSLLYITADFEPYKSNKRFDDLSKEEWMNWYKFSNNFTKMVFDIVGHDNLCSIAKNVTYAPSMNYISKNSFDTYGIYFNTSTITQCVREHILLGLCDEYTVDDNYDYLYITEVDNEEEYNEFAENKIKEILTDWDEHPDKLQEVVDYNKYIVEMKTRDQKLQKEKNKKKTISYLNQFIKSYANISRVYQNKNGKFSTSANVIFAKFNSGICDTEIDSLVKCKNWLIEVLNLDQDMFEQYVDTLKYEEKLIDEHKFKEAIQMSNERKNKEKMIKELRKSQYKK